MVQMQVQMARKSNVVVGKLEHLQVRGGQLEQVHEGSVGQLAGAQV